MGKRAAGPRKHINKWWHVARAGNYNFFLVYFPVKQTNICFDESIIRLLIMTEKSIQHVSLHMRDMAHIDSFYYIHLTWMFLNILKTVRPLLKSDLTILSFYHVLKAWIRPTKYREKCLSKVCQLCFLINSSAALQDFKTCAVQSNNENNEPKLCFMYLAQLIRLGSPELLKKLHYSTLFGQFNAAI